jgi:periplasmic divalent cation tolerance protein
MTAVTLYAVFADPAEAQRIGHQMVEERLAACVNILQPYRLIERITELHSYSVPALAVWPIVKLPAAYGDWVETSIG